MRDTYTTEEIVAKMQKDISLTPVQAEVVNPSSGRAATATIAFTIAYKGKSPQLVAQVVNELTSSFLEQNLKDREQKARTAVSFLEKQRDELDRRITTQEDKIAAFKQTHINELPELMQLNLQSVERLDKDLASLDEQLRTLANRKVYLEGQLATVDPFHGGKSVMSPSEELDALRRELIGLKASRSAMHPDVQALEARIRGLEIEYGIGADPSELARRIESAERNLADLRQKYASKHPDVRQAEKILADLRLRAADLSAARPARSTLSQPDNPAYIALRTQIAATEMDMQGVRAERVNLAARHEAFRARLEKSPLVEQEYSVLMRDLTDAQQQYQQTVSRLMAAQEALVLEKEQVGEKMTLIAPPVVPEKPSSPNRLVLLVVGLVLAVGVGVGIASLTEFMDTAVHGPEELAGLSGVPVLAVIPYISTPYEQALRRRRRVLAWAGCGGAILAALAGVHWFVRPLDVLLMQVIRKISLYW